MKLSELKQRVDQMVALGHGEEEVVVVRSDPSVGAIACTAVKAAGSGFDWDKGKFQLWPEKPLYQHNDQTQIQALQKTIDGLTWDNMNLKKGKP